MQTILIGLLETQASIESLCQLIFKLEFWIVSKNINERICALETYKLLTKRYIGILRVRELALDTIQMLLFIDQLLHSSGNEKPSNELRSLNQLKKELYIEKVSEQRL